MTTILLGAIEFKPLKSHCICKLHSMSTSMRQTLSREICPTMSCGYSRPRSSLITTSLKNTTSIEKLAFLSHGGTIPQGLFPGVSKEEKHVGGMKQQQAHLHPPEPKEPTLWNSGVLPRPPIHPSQPWRKSLFLKMLVEEASAVAI